MATVGVVFGGRSVEHQVSIVSARTVASGLREAGHDVIALGIAQDGCWMDERSSSAVLAGAAKAIPPLGMPPPATLRHLLAASANLDAVFPIVHGTWGEDGTLQGLFEMLDLPYVGPGVTASAVAMDKLLSKRQLQAAHVPVVEHLAFERRGFQTQGADYVAQARRLGFPLFVKPSVGGSSVGVRRVERVEDLAEALQFAFRFDEVVLVERGIVGRELECAVLGYRELEASAVGEIVPGNSFYDYADKYLSDNAQLLAPAPLSAKLAEQVRTVACAAASALGIVGLARVDFLLEGEDRLYVNELNTLPGFTRISMYPRLWALAGVPLPALVDRLVAVARERHEDRRRLDAGIKEFLATLPGS
jgi:D-alanine-D-alanine ligase